MWVPIRLSAHSTQLGQHKFNQIYIDQAKVQRGTLVQIAAVGSF